MPTINLGDFTGGQVYDALPIEAASPLVIDRALRDRIAINDPRSARLIRPALTPADIRAWYHLPPARSIIAIPCGWTNATLGQNQDEAAAFAALAARHPPLARTLAPQAEALRHEPHGDFWWELPRYPIDFFAAPSIAWTVAGPLLVAPSLAGAFLLQGITFTTAPTAFLLGVLGSQAMQTQAAQLSNHAAADAVHLPIPGASEAEQVQIGALAEQLAEQAGTRQALDREVTMRVTRDLAPPGATLGPVLAEWWRLSFEEFRTELEQRFKSDVPYRFREPWQAWLNSQRVARQIHDATIARLEAELNEQVQRLAS